MHTATALEFVPPDNEAPPQQKVSRFSPLQLTANEIASCEASVWHKNQDLLNGTIRQLRHPLLVTYIQRAVAKSHIRKFCFQILRDENHTSRNPLRTIANVKPEIRRAWG